MARTKKLVVRRKVETVRERANKQIARNEKPSRHSKVAGAARGPLERVKQLLRKQYHPIKLPDTKLGNALTKKRSAAPSYFIDSVSELKQVQWPPRKQAISLSIAVIVFSLVIAIFVQLLDYGLGKLFKEVILK